MKIEWIGKGNVEKRSYTAKQIGDIQKIAEKLQHRPTALIGIESVIRKHGFTNSDTFLEEADSEQYNELLDCVHEFFKNLRYRQLTGCIEVTPIIDYEVKYLKPIEQWTD